VNAANASALVPPVICTHQLSPYDNWLSGYGLRAVTRDLPRGIFHLRGIFRVIARKIPHNQKIPRRRPGIRRVPEAVECAFT
jgi:hypothetical protein